MAKWLERRAVALIAALSLPCLAHGQVVASNSPMVVESQTPVGEMINAASSAPLFTAEIGAFGMIRSGPRKSLLGNEVNLDTGATLRSATTGGFDYKFAPGAMVGLAWHTDERNSWDLKWRGIDRWISETSLLTTTGSVATTTPVSPFQFVLENGSDQGGLVAQSRSYFNQVLFGRTHVSRDDDFGTVKWFGGIGYTYFRDALTVDRSGTQDVENYGFSGNNNNVCGVIGLDVGKHVGFLTLGLKGLVGLGANFAHVNGAYNVVVNSTPGILPASLKVTGDDRAQFTANVDLGCYLTLHCDQHWKLNFGYDFLLLTGQALGSEQPQGGLLVVTQDPTTGTLNYRGGKLGSRYDGLLALNGLTASVEFTW